MIEFMVALIKFYKGTVYSLNLHLCSYLWGISIESYIFSFLVQFATGYRLNNEVF